MTTEATTIHFEATLYALGTSIILRVPEDESLKLPSRGQISVKGKINGHEFQTVLEPDGYWSHWMRIDDTLHKTLGVSVGDTLSLEITPIKEWPEPIVPDDFSQALNAAPDIHDLWAKITPMARWEWIRWVNATSNTDTRQRRIDVSISKMRSGKRRPCCFNLAACTDPELSRSGRLMQAA